MPPITFDAAGDSNRDLYRFVALNVANLAAHNLQLDFQILYPLVDKC